MEKKIIETDDFLRDSLYVLRETFEGSREGEPSAYLDRGIGIFSTIEGFSYVQASQTVEGSTAAAHTEHLKFYVDRLVEYMEGRKEPVNWEQSWLIETVDEQEWDILRKGVKNTYEKLLKRIAEIPNWNQESIGGMIAIIAHSAYHLGAIRQIAKATTDSSSAAVQAETG